MNQSNGGRMTGGLADDAPIDEVDEQLVAYLDGELAPNDRKELEVQLGRDAQLRARLRTLQDGWELLDDLPMATPSAVLLESTLRMAAIDSTGSGSRNSNASRRRSIPLNRWITPTVFGVFLLSLVGFASGAVAVRVIDHLSFQNQLRQLPIALHIDAYLHGTDLELIRSLREMPQWQQAVAISAQLGEWDFRLERTVSQATPSQRREILPELSIEDQQEVTEAWNRFEQLSGQQRETVLTTASQVTLQSDADELLQTMRRYAQWRQSLPSTERAAIEGQDTQQRKAAIAAALERTIRQWKQQTARILSDAEFEAIYQTLRQIAQIRINEWLEYDEATLPEQTLQWLDSFGANDQAIDPRFEADVLRRMLDTPDGSPPRNDVRPGREPPSAFAEFWRLIEQIRGPLVDYELYMIESKLSPGVAQFLAAASRIDTLGEELLQGWAEEAIRRMSWRRGGATLSERYESIDPSERDQLDLQTPDRLLEFLREQGRRRHFP